MTDAAPGSGEGHLVAYHADPDRSFGAAFVAGFVGDADDLAVVRWLTGAGTATEVDGHRGWSGSYELPPDDDGTGDSDGVAAGSGSLFVSTLVWEEAPGVLGLVQTFGPREDDARAVAASLRPATDDEWARLLHLGERGDTFGPDEAPAADAMELDTVPVEP